MPNVEVVTLRQVDCSILNGDYVLIILIYYSSSICINTSPVQYKNRSCCHQWPLLTYMLTIYRIKSIKLNVGMYQLGLCYLCISLF